MNELLTVNVNAHTESKNGLSYLSWAWAWAEVLKIDPQATWVVHTYGPQGAEEPCMRVGKSAMVHVSVTLKGLRRECMLPVMDHRNKAIPEPDAFQVNTAIMRCLAKAIAMHGLGLYIYAGEDLPPMDTEALDQLCTELVAAYNEGKTMDAVNIWYGSETIRLSNEAREYCWGQLRDWSAIRSAIKANKPETQLKEAA
jgi:hypothetical protein